MLKKVILAAGAATAFSAITLVTPLGSYLRCGTTWLTQSASDAVPLEWELKRARTMIEDLHPEIARNARQIARERIELAKLERQAQACEEAVAQTQSDIERLTADLKRGDDRYTYAGRTYTSVQVKDDLAGRFNRFKTRRETSQKLSQMLDARQASLRSAGERMDAMLSAKSQLEVEIENLQARIGSLRVAQTSSELKVDDSHLARTRELLDQIATRIDVEEETLAVDSVYFGQIDLNQPSHDNLLEEIAAYLSADDRAVDQKLAAIDLSGK